MGLGEVKQSSGKRITAFALAGSIDSSRIRGGTFEREWPPRSGRTQSFPEVDRAEWFTIESARAKIVPGQRPFLDRLRKWLEEPSN
jgi:predicted NUDIX family NTP pyrophosphohydrolase